MLDDRLLRNHEATYELNETAMLIVSLCNGTHTVREIAGVLASRFDVSRPHAEADVSVYVRRLRERGLVA